MNSRPATLTRSRHHRKAIAELTRHACVCVLQVEHLYVLCGGPSRPRDLDGMAVWRFQLGQSNWEKCEPTCTGAGYVPAARQQCCAVLVNDGKWLVHGGISVDGQVLSDMAEFDITTHVWGALSLTNPHIPGTSEHVEVCHACSPHASCFDTICACKLPSAMCCRWPGSCLFQVFMCC
jgi:hypothetical protein